MIILTLYILTLFVILIYSIQSLYLYLLSFRAKKKQMTGELGDFPFVTVQLPLYNERFIPVRLIEACCRLDYPRDKLQIQILDDSTDDTTSIVLQKVKEYQAQGYDIELIHRNKRAGFKAGALDNAMKSAKGEFIALFDADFEPDKNFLKELLPCFINIRAGFVQTAWKHNNSEYSILTYLQDLRLKSHFHATQKPRFNNDMLISFDGSSGIWRRKCIEDAGGWQSDTLAEDMDLAVRAQLKGWKGVFSEKCLSSAELPHTVNNLKTQQFRWTKGITEVFLKSFKNLTQSGISLKNKMDTILRLSSNLVFPLILLITILNIPVYNILRESHDYSAIVQILPVFLLALVTTFLTLVLINKKTPGIIIKRVLIFPLFLSGIAGISVSNTFAFFEALLGFKSPFERTRKDNVIIKGRKKAKSYLIGFIELIFAAYSVWGVYFFIMAGDIFSIIFQVLIAAGYIIFAYCSFFK